MRKNRVLSAILVAAAVVSVSGCNIFGGSKDTSYRNPMDKDLLAARVVASVTSQTHFQDPDQGALATFRATLFDASGRQYYGPTVQLDGADVTYTERGSSTIYTKDNLPYAAGTTWTVAIQSHTATSPAALPPLVLTAPTSTKGTNGVYAPVSQTAGQPFTISWAGGDPSVPVFVVVHGNPDGKGERRFFVSDNPAQRPDDPENFGLPIANTGTCVVPATVIERVVDANGNTSTRQTTVFDNTNKTGGAARTFYVYVVQRNATSAAPIEFAVNSTATATLTVAPRG